MTTNINTVNTISLLDPLDSLINYPYVTAGVTNTVMHTGTIDTTRQLKVAGDSYMDGDVEITGNLKVDDIDLAGHSMNDRLKNIEKQLNILLRNIDLEERWRELRDLGEQYRKLEEELLSKELMWKILKD
jgi:hypothetical protein